MKWETCLLCVLELFEPLGHSFSSVVPKQLCTPPLTLEIVVLMLALLNRNRAAAAIAIASNQEMENDADIDEKMNDVVIGQKGGWCWRVIRTQKDRSTDPRCFIRPEPQSLYCCRPTAIF